MCAAGANPAAVLLGAQPHSYVGYGACCGAALALCSFLSNESAVLLFGRNGLKRDARDSVERHAVSGITVQLDFLDQVHLHGVDFDGLQAQATDTPFPDQAVSGFDVDELACALVEQFDEPTCCARSCHDEKTFHLTLPQRQTQSSRKQNGHFLSAEFTDVQRLLQTEHMYLYSVCGVIWAA